MAITIETKYPDALLQAIKEAIKAGKVTAWEIYNHENVEYLTQATGPLKKKAYLKAVVATNENKLKFGFYGAGKPVNRSVYADYHGRFIQLLLEKFEDKFVYASAGSKALSIDKFTLEP